jgi:hypothetical protein
MKKIQRFLRKGNPTSLSITEVEFWKKNGGKNKLPEDTKRLICENRPSVRISNCNSMISWRIKINQKCFIF